MLLLRFRCGRSGDSATISPMLTFKNIDLTRDPAAARYAKVETVNVTFAAADGAVASREGLNHYHHGDALVTGSTGDHWSVTRARFDSRYEPVPPLAAGAPGAYRSKPVPVLAKQVHEPFSLERVAGGDVLEGKPGDWVMQYAPGDYGIVEGAKFARVYRKVAVA